MSNPTIRLRVHAALLCQRNPTPTDAFPPVILTHVDRIRAPSVASASRHYVDALNAQSILLSIINRRIHLVGHRVYRIS